MRGLFLGVVFVGALAVGCAPGGGVGGGGGDDPDAGPLPDAAPLALDAAGPASDMAPAPEPEDEPEPNPEPEGEPEPNPEPEGEPEPIPEPEGEPEPNPEPEGEPEPNPEPEGEPEPNPEPNPEPEGEPEPNPEPDPSPDPEPAPDPGQPIPGCAELSDCAAACPDPACQRACIEAAPPGALQGVQAVNTCATAAGCVSPEGALDDACLTAECRAEVEACFGVEPPPEGEGTCAELNDCLTLCPPDDVICGQACADDTAPGERALFDAVFACIDANGCEGPDGALDEACYQAACAAELEACLGPPPGPDGDGTCAELNDCLGLCPPDDAPCGQRCVRETSPDALARYDAIFDCIDANGCQGPDGMLDEACYQAACAAELAACFGPAPDPEPEPAGEGTCAELNDCLTLCPPGDAACGQACADDTAPGERALFDAIFACIDANGCQGPDGMLDEACYQAACAAELEACFGPGPVPEPEPEPEPEPGSPCVQLAQCVTACNGGAQCERLCRGGAEPDARAAFEALEACAAANGCGFDDQPCLEAACFDPLVACVGGQPAPAGDLTCSAYNACLDGCPDDACVADCRVAASPEGAALHDAALACVEANGCLDAAGAIDDACADAACAAEIDACLGPRVRPVGQGTCAALNDCLIACPDGDQPCVDACVTAASPDAHDRLLAAAACVEASGCPADDAACAQAACGVEIEACLVD